MPSAIDTKVNTLRQKIKKEVKPTLCWICGKQIKLTDATTVMLKVPNKGKCFVHNYHSGVTGECIRQVMQGALPSSVLPLKERCDMFARLYGKAFGAQK